MVASAFAIVLWLAIGLQRLAELVLAQRNRRRLLARGAIEVGARHYPLLVLLHVGWLVGWPLEIALRGPALASGWSVWLALFLAAQGLRYWAITSLGERWNTRILVLRGEAPIARGPYRFVPHPNYIAVALELLAVPLIFGATVTAAAASLVNAALLLGVRIPAENRALGDAAKGGSDGR